jgi:hypothetical protein
MLFMEKFKMKKGKCKMKKRILALFIAMIMVVIIIPVEIAPVYANSYPVALKARNGAPDWGSNCAPFVSELYNITGNTNSPQTLRIDNIGHSSLVSLALMPAHEGANFCLNEENCENGCDIDGWRARGVPRLPAGFRNGIVQFTRITVNDGIHLLDISDPPILVDLLSQDGDPDTGIRPNGHMGTAGFVDATLWHGWHEPARRIPSSGIATRGSGGDGGEDGVTFSVNGANRIYSIEVEFNIVTKNDIPSTLPSPETSNETSNGSPTIPTTTPPTTAPATAPPTNTDPPAIVNNVLSTETLQAIKQAGVLVKIELSCGMIITIDPQTITDTSRSININISIEVNEGGIIILPDNHGEFGLELNFNVTANELSEAGLSADNARLFHVDENGKVTVGGSINRNADGSVTITISHASHYILQEIEMGNITGEGEIGIGDALQILRYLANMSSVIDNDERALIASLIVSEDAPAIGDALEILRKLADMPNLIDNTR